jgi:carboxylesterase
MSKLPCGVLILHGFSSSLDCVNGIEPPLKQLNLPTRMPVLRGHGAESPEALRGVKWQEWVEDGEAALHDLLIDVEKAIVFGHSMGALVALHLAVDYPDLVDSLILAAPCIAFTNPLAPGEPLHFLSPLVVKLLKKKTMHSRYADPTLAQYNTNYRWVPTDAVATLFDFSEVTRKRLSEIKQPIYIIQSHQDRTVPEKAGDIILNHISTPPELKRRKWFSVSGHGMFQDCERRDVIQAVVDYVGERTGVPEIA